MAKEFHSYRGDPVKYAVSQDVRFKLDAACSSVGQQGPCKTLLHGLVDTHEDLSRQGVVWLDIHPGNLGVAADGRWKILDVGNSLIPVKGKPPITPLRGRLRRVRRLR
jgi:hypothetical protein